MAPDANVRTQWLPASQAEAGTGGSGRCEALVNRGLQAPHFHETNMMPVSESNHIQVRLRINFDRHPSRYGCSLAA
jgi:hypothetical protein